jgi:hypothetical protein
MRRPGGIKKQKSKEKSRQAGSFKAFGKKTALSAP